MLKTRIISSVIGLLLFLGAIAISVETLTVAIFVLAIFGINEFYSSMSNIGFKPIKPIGYILCLIILFAGFNMPIHITKDFGFMLFFVFIFVLYAIPVFSKGKYNTTDVSITLYGIFYIVFLFLFIVLLRRLEYGIYYVGIILLGAWGTDTFAYFGGKLFGKKKLAPHLSPNKTVEGSISGVLGSVILMALYGIILVKYANNISYYHYIIIGVLCGIISQVGDLVASSTKRYTKIKDYGYVIPGHGGVLDRFDSVLFIAPVVYFYILFFV